MMDYSTWAKAEAAYRNKGMSEKDIKAHKKAWKNMKKAPQMKPHGLLGEATQKAVSRKSKLEQLAAELDGKEF